MSPKRTYWPIVVAMAGALSVSLARADAPTDEIDEIVVNASRTAAPLGELPYAVTVVDVEAIQRARPLLGIDEALQDVPGVLIQNRFNFAQDLRISVRGFGARAAFGVRGLRILIDGIPATLPDGQSGVDGIDVGATGRVEVLRGSGATRYGNAGGGVLLIETQRGTAQPELQARSAFGSDGYRRQQLGVGGEWGGWNLAASASDLDVTGFREFSAARNRQLSARAERRDAQGEWLFSLHHTDQPEAFDPGGVDRATADATPRAARPANVAFHAGEALQQTRFGWRHRRPLGRNTTLTWRQYGVVREFDGLLPFGNGGAIDLDRRFWGGGLEIERTAPERAWQPTLVAGFDVDRQRDDRQRFVNLAGTRGALTLDQRERVSASGAFVLARAQPAADWYLDAGLRFDSVRFGVGDNLLANGDDGGSRRFSAWSPSLGVTWAMNAAWRGYASVSRSFETPTTTELANPDEAGGFNPDLEPQRALQYEIGVRRRSGIHAIDAAVYRIDVDDELVPFELSGSPGRDFFANAGRSTREGLELRLVSAWSPTLTTRLSATRSDFRFAEFVDDNGNDFSGRQVPGTARHTWHAALDWRPRESILVGVEATRVGAIVLNNANTESTEAFTRIELRAAWSLRAGRWSVEPWFAVSNALDEHYTANARINAFGSRYYEAGPDRAVYLGVSARLPLGD